VKLRAYMSLDADFDNFRDAAAWQTKIEELATTLGKDFDNVQCEIKVRRDRDDISVRKRRAAQKYVKKT
jgi:hypothetical protein